MDPQVRRYVYLAIFGLIAGWLAGIVVGHPKGGIIGSMIAGVLGSIVGGFVFSALNISFSVGNAMVDSLIKAVIGAAIVILVARIFLS